MRMKERLIGQLWCKFQQMTGKRYEIDLTKLNEKELEELLRFLSDCQDETRQQVRDARRRSPFLF